MTENRNRTVDLVKKINSSNFKGTNSWQKAVIEAKTWFERNIHNYDQSRYSKCSLIKKKVRHDSSGFVGACLFLMGIDVYGEGVGNTGDGGTVPGRGVGGESDLSCPPTAKQYLRTFSAIPPYLPQRVVDLLRIGGFSEVNYSGNNLLPFDIIVAMPLIEIYCGRYYDTTKNQFVDLSFTWSSVHDTSKGGMPSLKGNRSYKTIWRFPGAGTEIDLSPVIGKSGAQVEELETPDIVNSKIIKEDLDNLTYASSSDKNSEDEEISSSESSSTNSTIENEDYSGRGKQIVEESADSGISSMFREVNSSYQDLVNTQLENGLPAIGTVLF